MESTLASVIGPFYMTLGLSILFYQKQWRKVFEKWGSDHLSLLPLAFMKVILGLIIITLHNVWEWNIWILVTITGWALFIKGVLYFLAPENVIKDAFKLGENKALLYLGGIAALVMGVALSYYTYLA